MGFLCRFSKLKLSSMDKPNSVTIMENLNGDQTNFDSLFNMNVPHILENIFFSLDYKSFTTCKTVNKAWNILFSTTRYQKHLKKKEIEKRRDEEKLFKAASRGKVEVVRRLIYDHMVDVNFIMKKKELRTPMAEASYKGHISVVKILLEAGADIEKGDERKNTPLHLAALFGHYDIVKLLLDAGAKANCTNSTGRNPFYHTCNSDIAKRLIEYGADPKKADNDGYTNLHVAVWTGNPLMINTLIEGGADPVKRTEYKETPLEMAIRKDMKEIIKLLMDKISSHTPRS